MKLKIAIICLSILWTGILSAESQLAIAPGTIPLAAETAGQSVPLAVSGGSATAGMNLYLQVGGGTQGPVITKADMVTGSIWGATAEHQVELGGSTSRTVFHATVTPAGTVTATGTAVTLTLDTTGVPGGEYPLKLNYQGLFPTQVLDVNGAPIELSLSEGILSVPYTLTYLAGPNGSISGDKTQHVHKGGSGSQVTAVADPGYHFDKWSDDVMTASRTDTNITGNINVTANFAINSVVILTDLDTINISEGATSTFQVKLSAQPTEAKTVTVSNFSGDSDITVSSGASLTFTTLNWGDYQTVTLAAAQDADTVNGSAVIRCLALGLTDKDVTATEADNDYTVTFDLAGKGTRTGGGELSQTVNHGTAATAPTVSPNTGWTFTGWDLAFNNVTSNLTVTAQYSIASETYSVTFIEGANGTITGAKVQTVNKGADCTAVTAVPNTGYRFVEWTGDVHSTSNQLLVKNVTGNMNITANFAEVIVPPWAWAKKAGSSDNDWGQDVRVDSSGNSYTVGYFAGTSDFGNGYILTSSGLFDVFIAKHDSNGNCIWAKKAGGAGSDFGNGLRLDSASNCHIVGAFSGTADFGNGISLTSNGQSDLFLAKFDSNGNCIWAKKAGGTTAGDTVYAQKLSLDSSGNCIVTGSFFGTNDFGNGNVLSSPTGNNDLFIAKYDVDGTCIWAKKIGSSFFDSGYDICTASSGNFYLTGIFGGTTDFGSGNILTGSGIFVAKYDSDGTCIWAKKAGGSASTISYGMSSDTAGNVYITGCFYQSADFAEGISVTAAGQQFFIAKYDNNGNCLWARAGGSTGGGGGKSVALDSDSNIYLAGSFSGSVDFGNGIVKTSAGGSDIFAAKYDQSGTCLWAKSAGCSDLPSTAYGYGIDVTASGDCYVTGSFSKTASFGTEITLASAGQNDAFVAKIAPQAPTSILTMNVIGSGTTTPKGSYIVTQGVEMQISATSALHYHFVNWTATPNVTIANVNSAITTVILTDNASVTANFATDTHAVTFDLAGKGARTGGGELSQTVNHGAAAIAPTVEADAGWTFTGWDKTFSNITANTTVTAQYAPVTYTVTFDLVGKGTRTGGGALSQTVNYGAAATAPTVSANTGWTFTGWDKTFNSITANTTVTAQYAPVTYTVTFDLAGKGARTGGGELSQTVNHGTAATAPTVSPNTGWTFTGWDLAFNNVTSNLAVTAQYGIVTYTVTFVEGANGTITGTKIQTVNHGADCSEVTAVANTGYKFVNWTGDYSGTTNPLTISGVTANKTITANFTVSTTVADANWLNMGMPGFNDNIHALAFDSTGKLYAGGKFTSTGEVSANYIAKWNGSGWSALGEGLNWYVFSLAGDSSGNLYAGGYFTTAGGVSANGIAKWNGSEWSALGEGLNGHVWALAFDSSGNLYAGGDFTASGEVPVNHIAMWNGSKWSALGTGVEYYVSTVTFDSSGNLYVGGEINSAGGVPAQNIAKWDGFAWSALSTGMNGSVTSLAFDSSGNLYAGGNFTVADGNTVNHVAKQDGDGWMALGSGINGSVSSLVFDSSGTLYAGGIFTNAGGVSANNIATWDGIAWKTLGSGTNDTVRAIAFDSTGNLYAGGHFTYAGGKASAKLAKCLLMGSYSIAGRITKQSDSSNLSGVKLSLSQIGNTVSYPNGTYGIAGLVNDTYTVTPNLAGYSFTPANRTVIIDGGNQSGMDFAGSLNQYTVTFDLDGKGTRTGGGALIQTINYGLAATAPTLTANAGWTFTGWDKTFNSITANTTVTAQYAPVTYTVTFDLAGKGTRTGGGALSQTVNYGAAAIAPTISANAGWAFTGWDKTFNNITANTTVTAQYSPVTYTVTFDLAGKGTRTGGGALSQTVNYGAAAIAPTISANAGWAFTGWDKTFSNITANTTVTAQYSPVTYTVTFDLAGKGTRTGGGALSQTVNSGAAATAPTVSANTGWTFTGWNKTFSNITANTTVTAQYSPVTYIVTFDLAGKGTRTGGGALSQTINHGAAATAPTLTANAGWTFTGWDKTFNNITANTTITAQYAVATYTVTYVEGTNGTITGTKIQTVNHGASCTTVTAVPNAGYHFDKWSDNVATASRTDTNVTTGMTVTANFAINSVAIITDLDTINVTEGSTNTLQVKLSAQPTASRTVTVSRFSGDSDITVSSGSSLTFTTSNWGTYQTVILAAAQDADTVNGSAVIRCSSSGLGDKDVAATEVDDDTTLTVTNDGNGTSTPSGATVVTKSAATSINATASNGYHFVNWTATNGSAGFGNANSASTTAAITAPATIRANFAINSVAILTDLDTINVTEGSTNTFQVKLSAQPNASRTVTVSRFSGDSDITVSSGSSLTFTTLNWDTYQTVMLAAAEDADTANGTATIRCSSSGLADKDVIATELDNDYTLTVNNDGNGTTTPSGVSLQTKTVATEITATASSGYHFINWTATSGAAVFGNANSASTTVTASADATIRANFAINSVTILTDVDTVNIPEGATNTFQVKLSAQPTASRTVTISRSSGDNDITVSAGLSLTFTTSNWDTYQTVTLAAAEDADTLNGSAVIRCSSEGLPDKDVASNEGENDTTLTVSNDGNGTCTPSSATVVTNSAATSISASANAGYHFVNWTVTSGSASFGNASAADTTVAITAPAIVCANFAINTYTLAYTAGANGKIAGTASQTVNHGADGTAVTAVPDTGYHFVKWSDDVATETRTDLNVTANLSVTANFAHIQALLTVAKVGDGTVSPATGLQDTLTEIPIEAAATAGSRFYRWTVSGGATVADVNSEKTTVTLTADGTVTANFVNATATLTMAKVGGSTVTPPEGAQSVETLTAIPIIATVADENYPFVNWTVSGDAEVADPDSANTTVILSGNATITANFILPIVNGTAITAISGTAGSVRQYKITVPACPLFEIKSYSGTGDADLTMSKDGIVLQCGSGATNSETLQIENPDAGDYIISLNASSDFDGLTLLAKYYIAAPSAPTSLAASKGTYADAILVTWNESAGATSYLVYRAEIKTIPADALAETPDTSYFDNKNLEAGKTYYYWVRAKNGGDSGTSDPSAMASGNISIAPVAPATVTASDGTYFDKIRVTWTKVTGATSYLVFRTDALTPAPDPANDIPLYQTTALYYDDFGDNIVPRKDDGTVRKYYYWIAAKNQNAVSALKSNDGYVSKKGPAKVAASVSYTDRIIVTWNAVPGATAYDVYRYDDRAYKLGETRINGEPVEALVFEDKTPAASNYYKVRAKYGEYYDSDPSATGAMGKIGSLAYVAATHLENGAVLPVGGVMAKGSSLYYSVEVPIGTARLVATLNGTSNAVANDCNLFAKFANFPTRTSYTAKGVENTTSEILTVSNPSPGTWYFLLYGVTDYSGVTLKVKCYSVCDIKLTQVPLNDLAVPFTATFKGMVVDESGNTGVPNIVLQVRNPITGLTSSLTKTDAKGAFTYSAAISSEGEYTFDFLFTEMIDPYKGIASHTVWTRKGCREENDYFDSSSYLAATPAALVQADVNGMRNFLNIRNGWEYGAVDEAFEAMWIEKTLVSASSDASLTGKLDNGLYMLFYGVEGAGVGNDMTTASAFSAAPFVVHVEVSKRDAVLSNLNALGIIDDTQKDAILAGNIGIVAVASSSSPTEDIDGNMNISLMGREQLETLANLAAGLTSAEVIDYSGDTMKQVTITLSSGREINVVATAFVK